MLGTGQDRLKRNTVEHIEEMRRPNRACIVRQRIPCLASEFLFFGSKPPDMNAWWRPFLDEYIYIYNYIYIIIHTGILSLYLYMYILIGWLEILVVDVTMLIGVNLMIFHKSMREARAEKFMVYLQDPLRLFPKRYPSNPQRAIFIQWPFVRCVRNSFPVCTSGIAHLFCWCLYLEEIDAWFPIMQ